MSPQAKCRSGLLAVGLAIFSGGASPLHGEMGPASFRRSAARISGDECSSLALQATLAKARAEMRTLAASERVDPSGIGAAMDKDRRLSDEVKRAFGNSDVIKSEIKRGECVVTLKLSVDRLRGLARDL